MWNRFDRPLRLELGDSPLLLKILACLHLAGIAAWLVVPLPPFFRLSAIALLLVQFWRLHRIHVRPRSRYAVQVLYWEKTSGWKVRIADGWRPVTLCAPYYVTVKLVAVRFRIGRFRRVSAIVVGERTDADDFRRLRVRLLQCANRPMDHLQNQGNP